MGQPGTLARQALELVRAAPQSDSVKRIHAAALQVSARVELRLQHCPSAKGGRRQGQLYPGQVTAPLYPKLSHSPPVSQAKAQSPCIPS